MMTAVSISANPTGNFDYGNPSRKVAGNSSLSNSNAIPVIGHHHHTHHISQQGHPPYPTQSTIGSTLPQIFSTNSNYNLSNGPSNAQYNMGQVSVGLKNQSSFSSPGNYNGDSNEEGNQYKGMSGEESNMKLRGNPSQVYQQQQQQQVNAAGIFFHVIYCLSVLNFPNFSSNSSITCSNSSSSNTYSNSSR